jgi:hypothetical protein
MIAINCNGVLMFIQIIIWVIIAIISALLAPKQQAPVPGIPDAVPAIADDQPIPVVFGTVWLTQNNVCWYGDLRTSPIHASSGGKK